MVYERPMQRVIRLCIFVLILLSDIVVADAGSRVVVVGIYEDPPLIFSDARGRIQGIAADLLRYVAKREQWKLDYRRGTWDQCTQWLDTGEIDLLPGVERRFEHENQFRLSDEAIAENWGVLYLHADADYADILVFDAQNVAVVADDDHLQSIETVFAKLDVHPRFVRAQTAEQVLDLVGHKQAAAGVIPRMRGVFIEKRYRVKSGPIHFDPVTLHFAMAEGTETSILDALDNHLKQLKARPNSLYYRSQKRWRHDRQGFAFPLWLKPLWIITAAGGLVGLIIVINIVLRRQVRLQTEALQNTIAEKETFESDLAIARDIQHQLVPARSQPYPGRKEFAICAALQPAKEVGGDFYDVFFIDRNALCIVVGDVSGKGVPAALFMAMTKTMIKSAARLLIDPEYILADVNREISRNNPSLTFVTVFLGILDLSTGVLTYASGGHNPPLFIGRRGNSLLLGEAQCPAIGIDDSFKYHQATVSLRHREGLLLFSDGVIEAEDEQGHLFTQEALMNTVSMTAGLTPEKRVDAVLERLKEFTGTRPLDDDVTLLALTYFAPNRVNAHLKTLYLRDDIGEIERIVKAITKVANTVACPPVVLHDVTLAMEEIFSNVVFYGFGDDIDHTITFTIAIEKESLILILQDEGIPFNPLNVRRSFQQRPLETRDKGGMGIELARNLMDRMVYRRERGKNILRMEKRFR